jgi:RNA polymerase sigma factor (sigma-70 family)
MPRRRGPDDPVRRCYCGGVATPRASDEELLAIWQGGDRKAGSELFQRHFSSILRFFANKVRGDVDDLVQRTFEQCVKSRDRFRQHSSFRTFLFGVARNVLREHLRNLKKARDRYDPLEQSVHDLGLSPTVLVARRKEQTLVLNALRRIPVEHQVCLELYFWEGMSGRELAEVLGEPEGTIRNRIKRSRHLLDEQLKLLAESDALLKSTTSDLEDWARSLRGAIDSAGEPDG